MGVVDGDHGVAVAGEFLDHDGVIAAVAARAVRVHDDGQAVARGVYGRAHVPGGERAEGGVKGEAGVRQERLQRPSAIQGARGRSSALRAGYQTLAINSR
ncbi:hypothetical protein [Streptomyces sp. Y2F8-2]|uniref:hypothetical protein n=1 Tax=Streptomyces sp. Y2F8-2 TaxID=2759675 RepID=UPI001F44B7E3|nr:hypothetical protein [Streptomyces sp. Y2F8-2]